MLDLQFRIAAITDMQPILDLVTSAYRGESGKSGWTTESHLLEGGRITADILEEDILHPNGRILLAYDGETLVSCVNFRITAPGRGYLGMFAVRPGMQGLGLGKVVLTNAELKLRTMGAQAIDIIVIEQRTELIEFYERRGYRQTGEHPEFPYGDDRFGVPQRDDLRMTALRKEFDPSSTGPVPVSQLVG